MGDDATGPDHRTPGDTTPPAPLSPTPPPQRVETLDVLRGAAILGILLVNIELFRGSRLYAALAGQAPPRPPADEVAEFVIGWLVSGKFLSSFALLFGVGVALITARSQARGQPARPLLARRHAWLAVLGLAHILLLFSGDILFVYGVGGMLLLPFVGMRTRAVRWAAAAILGFYLLLGAGFAAATLAGADPAPPAATTFLLERGEAARVAFTEGGPGAQLAARAAEAALVQTQQLLAVPWILGLFLVGLAVGRTDLLHRLPERAGLLARVAAVAMPLGLVVNLPLGVAGIPAGSAADSVLGALALPARLAGAPLLAVGYLAGLAWLCQRPRVRARLRPLQRTGRMALTAYLLESVLCTGFFAGLGFYDELTLTAALAVVAGVWVVVVAACSAWLRVFPMGPVERLWRRLTYGPSAPLPGAARAGR